MRPGVMDEVIAARDDGEVFARAARIGFAGVEVALRRDELRAPGQERLRRLVQARDASGLELPSLVLGDLNGGGLGSPDPAVAEAAAEDIRRAVGWAAELGADIILVPFFLAGELVEDADVDRAGRALHELCPLAAERGVRLCYEGTLPSDRVRDLAARVQSPAFGVYFDLANPVNRGMDTATELRALGDLVRRVHLKDTRVRGADVHPGLGRVDFAESVRALADVGYDGWLVFETPPAPEEVVRRDLSFARTTFPALEVDIAWPRFGAFSYEFAAGEWERLATTFAELGLATVQLGGALLDECLRDPEGIAPGVAALATRGIEVAGLAGYRNLVAPDARTRRENIGRIARCLELAPHFGTAVVTTEAGTRSPVDDWTDTHENWQPAGLELLAEALDELIPVAERSGSILALEPYVAHVLRTPGHVLGLLERYPTPHLQLVCDPSDFVSRPLLPAQDRVVADVLHRFEPRFVLAHLKDDVLGDGAIRTYLEFLRDRRPDLPLILEHLPLDDVPGAIARVERALARPSSP
jgi:L-ribulose-5-phosphate 3-epimerase